MVNPSDTAIHRDWQQKRIDFIKGLLPESGTILELGSFNGVIGNAFRELGYEVTSVEGRESNIQNIREEFPDLNVKLHDLDTANWSLGFYDIIINFGLFYHLENYHKEHLNNCLSNCNILFFETVVYDSEESVLYSRHEGGSCQSLSGIGKTPSTSYIEDILDRSCRRYTKYASKELNCGGQHYDWKDRNSKMFDEGARRLWVIS